MFRLRDFVHVGIGVHIHVLGYFLFCGDTWSSCLLSYEEQQPMDDWAPGDIFFCDAAACCQGSASASVSTLGGASVLSSPPVLSKLLNVTGYVYVIVFHTFRAVVFVFLKASGVLLLEYPPVYLSRRVLPIVFCVCTHALVAVVVVVDVDVVVVV